MTDVSRFFELGDLAATALNELGVHEVHGGENPRIIEYHKHTTLKAVEDEVPWCSAFVCFVVETNHLQSTKSAAARSWLTWGIPVSPSPGAIAVFPRGNNPNQGHVAIVLGVSADGTKVAVVGGNQGDSVSLGWYNTKDALSFRAPIL